MLAAVTPLPSTQGQQHCGRNCAATPHCPHLTRNSRTSYVRVISFPRKHLGRAVVRCARRGKGWQSAAGRPSVQHWHGAHIAHLPREIRRGAAPPQWFAAAEQRRLQCALHAPGAAVCCRGDFCCPQFILSTPPSIHPPLLQFIRPLLLQCISLGDPSLRDLPQRPPPIATIIARLAPMPCRAGPLPTSVLQTRMRVAFRCVSIASPAPMLCPDAQRRQGRHCRNKHAPLVPAEAVCICWSGSLRGAAWSGGGGVRGRGGCCRAAPCGTA